MSESAPRLPASARDPAPYRPVSGLAIAGLLVSGLFAAWVAVATLVAFWTGTPFLMSPAGLILPLAGFALSLAGRLQIRRSEGTRAGLPLTTWGIYLSVLFGLGYAAYRGATELAIRQQARDFTDAWFEQLKDSATEEAYLCTAFEETLPPGRERRLDRNHPDFQPRKPYPAPLARALEDVRRGHFWDEKGQKGLFPRFVEHDLIEVVRQGAGEAKIEAQGLKSWEYIGGSAPVYHVEQSYLVTTPTGEYTAVVSALGTDDKATGRRNWQVILGETGITDRKLTPRGAAAAMLRADSRRFAGEWLKNLVVGQLEDAYFDTLEPRQRQQRRADYRGRLVLAALAPADGGLGSVLAACPILGSPDMNRALFLPGLAKFATAEVVQSAGIMTPSPKMREAVLKEVLDLFRRTGPSVKVGIQVADGAARQSTPWKLVAGRLTFFQPFELRLGQDYRCEGMLVVQTESAAALAALESGTPEAANSLRLVGEGRNVFWRVSAVKLEAAAPPPKGGPGAQPPEQ